MSNVILFAVLVVIVYSLANNFKSSDCNYLEIGCMSFIAVFLCVSPALQINANQYPWMDNYESSEHQYAVFIILVFTISIVVGAKFGQKSNVNLFDYRVDETRYKFTSCLGPFICAALVYGLGGLDYLIEPRNSDLKLIANEEVDFIRTIYSSLLIAIPTINVLLYISLTGSNQSKRANHYIGAISILTFIIFCNPIATPRYAFGSSLLSFVAAFMHSRQSFRACKVLMIAIIPGLVLIFPVTDVFRNSVDVNISSVITGYMVDNPLIYKADFDAYQQVLNAVRHVEDYDYSYLLQILAAIFFFIPRSIWVEKSVASGIMVAESSGYSFKNLSMPLPAEFYIDGGLFFLVLGSIFIGFLVGKFRISKPGSVFDYLIIYLSFYMIFFLRGSLVVTFGYVIPLVVMFLFHIRGVR